MFRHSIIWYFIAIIKPCNDEVSVRWWNSHFIFQSRCPIMLTGFWHFTDWIRRYYFLWITPFDKGRLKWLLTVCWIYFYLYLFSIKDFLYWYLVCFYKKNMTKVFCWYLMVIIRQHNMMTMYTIVFLCFIWTVWR